MIRRVDRHPDRAAPVGVAAEHAGVGLRRQIRNAVLLAAGVEDVRMVGVVARQRADAELAEELVLVEHLGQHAAELGFVQDGGQVGGRRRRSSAGRGSRRAVRDAPRGTAAAAPPISGYFVEQFAVEHRGRAQRQQADHRPHLEPLGLAVGQAQHVVEEAVLLVPHARCRRPCAPSTRRSTGSARRT